MDLMEMRQDRSAEYFKNLVLKFLALAWFFDIKSITHLEVKKYNVQFECILPLRGFDKLDMLSRNLIYERGLMALGPAFGRELHTAKR